MTRYTFKTKPYRHQFDGVRFAVNRFLAGGQVALLMEPRCGKTKTAIDTSGCLHLKVGLRKVLIICPALVMGVWVDKLRTHLGVPHTRLVWDAAARKQGGPATLFCDHDGIEFVIVNFDAFSTPGKKLPSGARSRASGRLRFRDQVISWVSDDPALCIIDESHRIKTHTSKAHRTIVAMRKYFRYRMILTGTPITKSSRVHDIWAQWQFLRPEALHEFGETIEEFKYSTGMWIKIQQFDKLTGLRDGALEAIRSAIASDSFVVKRSDCFDLPKRTDIVRNVTLSAPSAAHYSRMANEFLTRIEDGIISEASIAIVVSIRLMQITSGFLGFEGDDGKPDTRDIGSEKLDVLSDIISDEACENGEKIVVAARFRRDIARIVDLCRKLKVKCFTIAGGMKPGQASDSVRGFREHQGGAVVVIQPQAASLGIDLSTASHMIWYSLTYSWVDFTQGCDRIALSDKPTTFTYLIVPGSIDQLAYEVLIGDGDIGKAILADPARVRIGEPAAS